MRPPPASADFSGQAPQKGAPRCSSREAVGEAGDRHKRVRHRVRSAWCVQQTPERRRGTPERRPMAIHRRLAALEQCRAERCLSKAQATFLESFPPQSASRQFEVPVNFAACGTRREPGRPGRSHLSNSRPSCPDWGQFAKPCPDWGRLAKQSIVFGWYPNVVKRMQSWQREACHG